MVKDLWTALTLDSLNTSHPIITGATDPDEINALFDSISYEKVSNECGWLIITCGLHDCTFLYRKAFFVVVCLFYFIFLHEDLNLHIKQYDSTV